MDDRRGGSRISKGGVDGRPYLLRGARENALTKKIGTFPYKFRNNEPIRILLRLTRRCQMASLRTFARKVAADDEMWGNNNQT